MVMQAAWLHQWHTNVLVVVFACISTKTLFASHRFLCGACLVQPEYDRTGPAPLLPTGQQPLAPLAAGHFLPPPVAGRWLERSVKLSAATSSHRLHETGECPD